MSYTAIISFLLMLGFLGVSTILYGGISLLIIVPIIISTGFLVKEVSYEEENGINEKRI